MSGTVFAIFWGSLRAFIPSSQTTTFCVILHQNWKNCSRPPFLLVITTKNTCLYKVEQNVISFLNELSGFSVVLKLIYSISREHFYYWVPCSHLLATVLKKILWCVILLLFPPLLTLQSGSTTYKVTKVCAGTAYIESKE